MPAIHAHLQRRLRNLLQEMHAKITRVLLDQHTLISKTRLLWEPLVASAKHNRLVPLQLLSLRDRRGRFGLRHERRIVSVGLVYDAFLHHEPHLLHQGNVF